MGFMARLLAVVGGISFLTACQTVDNFVKVVQDWTVSSEVTMINPPNNVEASQVRSITVIGDRASESTRQKAEAALVGVKVDNVPYFEVVEKGNAAKINDIHIEELTGHDFDKALVADFGKKMGTAGVYIISNVQTHGDVASFREKRKVCANDYEKKCDNWKNITVACRERTVRFSFTPKLVDVESMKVVYGRNIATSQRDKHCSGDSGTLESESLLLGIAEADAIRILSKDVAPYKTTEKVLFKTGDVSSEKAEELLERGEEFAEKGRWERACQLWKEVSELEPQSPSPWYNLGVCHERVGELNQAIDLYLKAEGLTMEVDQRISDRLSAAKEKLARQQSLQAANDMGNT